MYKGHIPASLIYVCASPTQVQTFDEEGEIAITEKTKVTPTFCIESTQNPATALKWTGLKNPRQVTLDNKPIKSVQVVDLEERGNGGRAYKVIVDGQYYFDLREDVLLESMLTLGIDKGGFLRGEYVWAKYNTSMKLVRHGSPLYEAFARGNVLHNAKELKKADLVVGGIYSTKKQQLMYLGDYNTFAYKQDENPKARGYFADKNEPYHINQRLVKERVELYLEIPEWLTNKGDFSKLTVANSQEMTEQPKFTIEFTELPTTQYSVMRSWVDAVNKPSEERPRITAGEDGAYNIRVRDMDEAKEIIEMMLAEGHEIVPPGCRTLRLESRRNQVESSLIGWNNFDAYVKNGYLYDPDKKWPGWPGMYVHFTNFEPDADFAKFYVGKRGTVDWLMLDGEDRIVKYKTWSAGVTSGWIEYPKPKNN